MPTQVTESGYDLGIVPLCGALGHIYLRAARASTAARRDPALGERFWAELPGRVSATGAKPAGAGTVVVPAPTTVVVVVAGTNSVSVCVGRMSVEVVVTKVVAVTVSVT